MKNLFLLFFAFLIAPLRAAEKGDPMNVLFISIDDLKPVLGCYGTEGIKTPTIDALARQGVTFQNNYCQQAVCAPSRVSLFTGMRPDRTGVVDLKTNMRNINPDVETLPQTLMKNGYITVGMGKLLHGAKDDDPTSWSEPYIHDKDLAYAKGFIYPANGKYQNPQIHEAAKEARKQKLGWKATNRFLKSKGLSPATECMDIPDDAYEDGALALRAVKALDKLAKQQQSFFLAIGFHKPHLPFSVPKKYWDLYDRDRIPLAGHRSKIDGAPQVAYHTWGELRNYSDIPQEGPLSLEKEKEIIHGYWAAVSYVDAQLGLVMDKLKSSGLDKNTMVVLWGDHGWHLGDHGQWCKHSNFEQATKAPLIFAVPGGSKGENAYTMSEFVDVYPTILDYLGIKPHEALEGVSLMPVIKNPKLKIKEAAFSQFTRGSKVMGYTMRTARYRVTLWLKGEYYKASIVEKPEIIAKELYDYQKDPEETTNFANNEAYADVFKSLKKQLLSSLKTQHRSYGKD